MRKHNYLLALVGVVLLGIPTNPQQHIIAEKDNTHPEIEMQATGLGLIAALSAERGNGINEIRWAARREDQVRKYIVEYSIDGINYQAAGEVLAGNGSYLFRHHLIDNNPAIYRIRAEQLNNRFFITPGILLPGANISPVKIYPTVVETRQIYIDSYWPIERVNIYSSGGAQVYARDLNGQRDHISLPLPSLARGMYWMSLHGRGWRTTEKFLVK